MNFDAFSSYQVESDCNEDVLLGTVTHGYSSKFKRTKTLILLDQKLRVCNLMVIALLGSLKSNFRWPFST